MLMEKLGLPIGIIIPVKRIPKRRVARSHYKLAQQYRDGEFAAEERLIRQLYRHDNESAHTNFY